MIKKCKVDVHVEFTVTNLNIGDIHKTLDLLEDLKINTFLARSVLWMGRANFNNKIFAISKKKYLVFLQTLYKEQQQRKILVHCQDPLFHQVIPDYKSKLSKYGDITNGNVISGCTAGFNMIHIRQNGDIGICTFLPDITLGNILTGSLEKIWAEREKNITLKAIINRKFKGKCGKCINRYICGGCRARALIINKNILESDPYCLVKRKK